MTDQTDIVKVDGLNKTIDELRAQVDASFDKKFEVKSMQFMNTVLADIKADQLLSIREEYSKVLKDQLDSHVRKFVDEKLNGKELPFTDNNLSKIIDGKLNDFVEHRLQSALSSKARDHVNTALSAIRAEKLFSKATSEAK